MPILLTDTNVERLVSLLALAETATSTEEYLRYAARAADLKRQHPELTTIYEDDPRGVQGRVAQYSEEQQELDDRYGSPAQVCPTCEGEGAIRHAGVSQVCPDCDGNGVT